MEVSLHDHIHDFCVHSFDSLVTYFHKHLPLLPLQSQINDLVFPIFVTWKRSTDSEIRGDMGYFSPIPLKESVNQVALISALQDRRYKRITKKELKDLSVVVEIFENHEVVEDPLDWEEGRHGVIIKFVVKDVLFRTHCMPSFYESNCKNKKHLFELLVVKAGCEVTRILWKQGG